MKDWGSKKLEIANYYKELIDGHGPSPRACDYGRPESQQIKFHVLSDAISLDGKSILDVGCGFADYAGYLQRHFHNIDYSGVDITPDCIMRARENYPGLDIHQTDILQDTIERKFNFVTANGIFYLLGESAQPMMHELINRMYELTDEAVAFNSLSSWCPDKEKGEFYADPLKTLEYCRSLTPWVTLRHDYHSRDFTIYMYRKKNI
jgi:SAM-dependent methyltransferase